MGYAVRLLEQDLQERRNLCVTGGEAQLPERGYATTAQPHIGGGWGLAVSVYIDHLKKKTLLNLKSMDSYTLEIQNFIGTGT